MANSLRRRDFLRHVGVAGSAATVGLWTRRLPGAVRSPNEKLNIGIIGTSRRGAANIAGVEGENLVALCDIDDRLLGTTHEKFPKAKTYNDFRKLLDQSDLDAVVISTPDHIHVTAAVMAMRRGKHVYCEKPLGHDVAEVRLATTTAAKQKVATQLGTQIHAGENYRRVVELIRAGAVGPVREVHVWVGRSWGDGDRPAETPPVPDYLHWNLWLGPAPERPYHPTYQPAKWRSWWDFGNGTLGDMGCHYMDLAFWALDLDRPATVAAEGSPSVARAETAADWLIVRYAYPARGDRPAVNLTWYDGGQRPDLMRQAGMPRWGDGVLFVGDDGLLLADYTKHRLLPEEKFRDSQRPDPSIPPSIGHHAEWIEACKTGRPTSCHFGYSGPLTEAVLLGNVAYRVGRKLEWDAANLTVRGCPEADRFLRREPRHGWEV